MTRVAAIAKNTLREVARERVFLVLVLFGLGLAGVSLVLAPLALGEGSKVVLDFGLAGASALSTLVVIVLGSSLLHKELDRRTIYAVMAKPIRRSEFLFGKYAGLWIGAAALLATMIALTALLLLLSGGAFPWTVGGALLLSLAELMIVTGVVVFFSSFTTPLLTAFFTAATLLAGHFAEDLLYFGTHGASRLLAALTEGAYWLLPHLEVFNARGLVVHGVAVGQDRLLFAAAYAALYGGALLAAAAAVFERRDFK
ncbi:MAG TPA: ABC transporter permease [Candidatus Eisenbacteria bacterium]|nr:ABC transporter permease [Candidatus Eisenbacteria bacterium]